MRAAIVALWLILLATGSQPAGAQSVMDWANEFPRTDFARSIVSFAEIRFDGPRRDTIPPILDPKFEPASSISNIGRLEPVISVVIGGEARAYPLRIMLWHEIVNDRIGGVPVLISDPWYYGTTPYVAMDTRPVAPGSFAYPLPRGLKPLDYVVVVGDRAWPLKRLSEAKRIAEGGLVLTWSPGRNSIHDAKRISSGRDLGNVIVRKITAPHRKVAHDVTFAFAFAAFVPDGIWMQGAP